MSDELARQIGWDTDLEGKVDRLRQQLTEK